MIARISKVEIVGKKKLLLEVLSVIRKLGVFHIEQDYRGFLADERASGIAELAPDEHVIAERLSVEDLGAKIDELTACLPKVPVRESYLKPEAAISSVAVIVEKHTAYCSDLSQQREALRKELAELNCHTPFIETLETLIAGTAVTENLDLIAVTLKHSDAVDHIRGILTKLTNGRFDIFTASAQDGSLVALVAVQKEFAGKVRQLLSDEHIPELVFPQLVQNLPFAEKVGYVRAKMEELPARIAAIDADLVKFAQRWLAIYYRVREWLSDQQSLFRTTAAVYETTMCFIICGWIPSSDMPGLVEELSLAFGGEVVVEEKDILEKDLEKVPVVISNPPYFQPFEIFARLLPLPHYTSFDPTIFIGIFFPIFFGMILGDAGLGLILLGLTIVAVKVFKGREIIRNAAKVLLICSIYSIFFGLLYGEFLGDLGHTLFGLQPLWMSRATSVMPMLYFAISVGIFHVSLGLVLGFISAVKRKLLREAVFKMANILAILCLIAFIILHFVAAAPHLNKVLLIAFGIFIPVLFIGGGLLAPLELLKSVGNIISYARIMAIGLASALLASVANTLGGMTGDIITGILVAALLHTVNLLLGVFAPTIQSLRLHYVEFFSKFLEHGGRRFDPYKKKS